MTTNHEVAGSIPAGCTIIFKEDVDVNVLFQYDTLAIIISSRMAAFLSSLFSF